MRIFVLSGAPALRAGLALLVRALPDAVVAGDAAPDDAPDAGDPAAAGTVDLLLAEVADRDELAALDSWLAALHPMAGLVVLAAAPPLRARRSGGDPGSLVAEVARLAAESDLAYGVMRREAATEEILAALRAVGAGLVVLDRQLIANLPRAVGPSASEAALDVAGEPLTARELDVLQLLAQGLPNKLIAQRLRISEHTAKYHVSAILTKLGAASRTEAVTTAAHRGLLVL